MGTNFGGTGYEPGSKLVRPGLNYKQGTNLYKVAYPPLPIKKLEWRSYFRFAMEIAMACDDVGLII